MNYVYGPVPSWRLGNSLGVDLLSTPERTCSFACRYCQLGDVKAKAVKRRVLAPTTDVIDEVCAALASSNPDVVTFSGMGEPTLASNLGEAIDAVHAITDRPVAVLTNASLFDREEVRGEVGRADIVVAKFDAPNQELFDRVNQPTVGIAFNSVFEGLQAFRKEYCGRFALQMMFICENKDSVEDFFPLLGKIRPDEIQLNTPLRPCATLPLSPEEMAVITKTFRHTFPGVGIRCVYEERTEPEKESEKLDTLRRRAPRHA